MPIDGENVRRGSGDTAGSIPPLLPATPSAGNLGGISPPPDMGKSFGNSNPLSDHVQKKRSHTPDPEPAARKEKGPGIRHRSCSAPVLSHSTAKKNNGLFENLQRENNSRHSTITAALVVCAFADHARIANAPSNQPSCEG